VTEVDPQLLDRVIAGDPAAFRALVETYDRLVTALLLDRVGARDDVHDLRQEVFFRVYKNLTTLRDRDKISSWVRGICRNVVREYWTSRARSAASLEDVGEPFTESSGTDDAASIEYAIGKALRVLPARYREILRLRYFVKMDYELIAETLGLSMMAVDALMRRAKGRLRDAVMPILEREDLK
jgi:RNA polymerase sigma-70 factor, ECF subfamily